jgi:mannose-1-phosphate guanylyltransferase
MARRSVAFVILAGGKGERLWPLVRANRPKVCLSPDGERSLLRATVDRLRPIAPSASWLIVTTQGQQQSVSLCLPPSLRKAVLVEPQGKNTAACMTLAAVTLASHDPNCVMVAAPADHWIGDVAAYQRAVEAAIAAAVRHDTLVTIGIQPTYPHPGLGYVRAGARLPSTRGRIYHLKQFIEKPPVSVAKRLIQRGRVYWNSGMFVGTADKFLECVTQWLPDYTRRLVPLASGLGQPRRRAALGAQPGRLESAALARRVRAAYQALEGISFDHGVMDHVDRGAVVEGRFPWADLGSLDAWAGVQTGPGDTVAVDSRNVTILGHEDHLVATVGVNDLLVVHTPSATLICDPRKTQAVREVVRRVGATPRLSRYR